MKKQGVILLALFTGIMFLSIIVPLNLSATTNTPTQGTTITITALTGTLYDKKAIDVQKNTQYTIVFWNNESGVWHNLIVAADERIVTSATASDTPKSGDLVLGPLPAEANTGNSGGTETSVWNTTFTTPDKDTYIMFYCSFSGHFDAGMWGYFKVGNPTGNPPGTPAPGFELAIGLLIIASLALVQRRKK
ncbi:MAG: Heimdall-CTERM domain-containing surface protein [Candidatus Thorarchaeota archaeon]